MLSCDWCRSGGPAACTRRAAPRAAAGSWAEPPASACPPSSGNTKCEVELPTYFPGEGSPLLCFQQGEGPSRGLLRGTVKVPLTALPDDPCLQLAGAGWQRGLHPDRRQRGLGLRRLPRRRHGRDTQAGGDTELWLVRMCNTDLWLAAAGAGQLPARLPQTFWQQLMMLTQSLHNTLEEENELSDKTINIQSQCIWSILI